MKIFKSYKFLFVLFVNSCASNKDSSLKAIDSVVDLNKFMGKWYVIASIPTVFERGAHNAIETYTWNPSENRIDIDFTFNKDSFEGKQKSIPQKAFIHNAKTNAEWRVQPFWPLRFAYLIVDLDSSYETTIIGVPDRDYVWIMARTPKISSQTYAALVKKTEALGYDISKLQKVPQMF